MSDCLPPSEVAEDEFFKCAICSKYAVDAMLLNCLHSACRSCTGDGIHTSVTCPTCQVTTDTPTWKTNLLVSSLAQRSLTLKDVFSCTQCMDDGNQEVTAVAWCYTCQLSLCVDCHKSARRVHATHKVMHLNESTNLSDLYRPPTRFCTEHNEEVKLACFTCKVGNCLKCAHHCYKSDHDVLPFDGPDALKRRNDSVTQATDVLSELNSAATQLQAHLNLPERVLSAREQSIALLKRDKKLAMDAISSAYENTEKSLLECWDCLMAQSLGIREKAERFRTRVIWINTYCQMALKSSDIAVLLPQLDEVSSYLQYCFDEARQFQELTEPSKMVRLNTWLPSDLDLIAIDWFGSAKLISDDFNSSSYIYPSEENIDYYARKVSTLRELELLLRSQKEERESIQLERQAMVKLQIEVAEKDAQLVSTQSEVKKYFDQQKELREQLERERSALEVLKSDVASKTSQLVSTQSEVKKYLDQQKELREQLERERSALEVLKSDVASKTSQLAASQNEVRKLKEQNQSQQKQLEGNRMKINQLQSELQSKTQLFDALQNEERKLKDQTQEQQKQLELNRVKIEQQQSELQSKTQQLVAQTKPLSFSSSARGTIKGPGLCWDVAVTPHGSLLVAATADGLKEYDATSFREMATWKPDSDLLGQGKSFSVRTVDVLSDGRAVVGLKPKHVVLLRRSVVSGSSAAADWRVERRLAKLQAPPKRLSTWDDLRLLAVLEDRWDESKKGWLPGPDLLLLLLSLNGSNDTSSSSSSSMRLKLQYNASSVAVTDRGVMVASSEPVELSDAVGCRKGHVVDCYSHLGVRLWRHEVGGGLKVMSVCTDSVGRVLYAAKSRGSVVCLYVDDGRELSTAITLSTKETEEPYAVTLDRATQHQLALISLEAKDKPNIVTIFSAA